MSQFESLESNKIGLVTQKEDGSIKQIGLNQEQSDMLQAFLMAISKDKPLVFMPEEYDFVLKNKAENQYTKQEIIDLVNKFFKHIARRL